MRCGSETEVAAVEQVLPGQRPEGPEPGVEPQGAEEEVVHHDLP
ncbi:hypothetical protein [Streptomyces marincola]|nr:hypothetical protein [Streptomyces marincola]